MRQKKITCKIRQYKNPLILAVLAMLLVACGTGEEGGVPIVESQNIELAEPKNIQFVEYDGKAFVSWGNAKGALNYKLYLSKEQQIDLDNIEVEAVTVYEVEGTSIEVSDLETNTRYFVAVESINGEQNKTFKLKDPVVLKSPEINQVLSAPANFEVTGLEGEIELHWEPLPEAFNYLIFFSSTDEEVDPVRAEQIQEVGMPPFRHKGLLPNKTYYYRISAITPIGLTPLSGVEFASVKEFVEPPPIPDRFSASVGDSLVALKWEPVHRAAGYNVYMAKEPILSVAGIIELNGGEVFSNISTISTNRLNLENGTTYYFRISATNANGESGVSKMLSATPKSVLPMVPSNISATSQNDGVKIAWSKVQGAEGYYLYWFDKPNASKQTAFKSDLILENKFLDVDLTSKDTIYYFVTADNEFGESEASAVVSVPVILPPAPNDVRVTNVLEKTVITWDPSSIDVDEYVLYIASEAGISKDDYFRLSNGKRLRNITNSTFELAGLLTDTQYYIAISSVNNNVEGRLSAEFQFRTQAVEKPSPPVISLIGAEQMSIIQGQVYLDLGATATDKEEGDLTDEIVVTSNVNSQLPGIYSVRYNVTDRTQLAADEVSRQVTVIENQRPVITLSGNNPVTIVQGDIYVDDGATAIDAEDGVLLNIELSGTVNTQIPGSYALKFNVKDSLELSAIEVQRTVIVSVNNFPVITLIGDATIKLLQGQEYVEANATASDAEDGDISSKITLAGSVDVNVPGTYIVQYDVKDNFGQTATVNRTVVVNSFSLATEPVDFLAPNMSASLSVLAVTAEDSIDIAQLGEWTSSNVDIIRVSNIEGSKGEVEAIGIGESVISVAYLGKIATWNIKVRDPSIILNYPFFIANGLLNGSLHVYLRIDDGVRQEMRATDAGLTLSLAGLEPGSYKVSIEIEFESDVYGSVMLAFSNNVMNILLGNNELSLFTLDYEYPDDNQDDESNLDSLMEGVDPQGCVLDASLFEKCFWN